MLQTVPGFQFDQMQTPGSWVNFSMTGTHNRHVLVQIDGVPQNFISQDSAAQLGMIPVQHIDRVEIVKGAASTSWGSALGGVVNIVTKSPDPDRAIAGTASAAAGEHHTSDLRGEVSGTIDRFGYYLTGGNLSSKGLLPGNRVNFNHLFGKLSYDLPGNGRLTMGGDFRDSAHGLEDYALLDYRDTSSYKNGSGYFNFTRRLADRLNLELNGFLGRRQATTQFGALSIPDLFRDCTVWEDYRAANARLLWGDANANLAAGVEYEHNRAHSREPVFNAPGFNFDLAMERVSGYLNGSYTIGRLTVLPGIRLDHTDILGNTLSYSLGTTLRLTDSTLLRLYGARGYSLPAINAQDILNGKLEIQNIETVQAGIETSAIPWLWLKTTLFYNNTWKIQEWDDATPANVILREQVRQGFEVEAKSSPLYGFALSGGYTYVDAWDKKTKVQLSAANSAPQHVAKLALNYDNDDIGLRGALTGSYVWWRMTQEDGQPRDKSMIWDLHLNQKLMPGNELSPELFFSVRNLFNGYQSQNMLYPNAPRWVEGGVRFRF